MLYSGRRREFEALLFQEVVCWTPFLLMFGREARLSADVQYGIRPECTIISEETYLRKYQRVKENLDRNMLQRCAVRCDGGKCFCWQREYIGDDGCVGIVVLVITLLIVNIKPWHVKDVCCVFSNNINYKAYHGTESDLSWRAR